MSFFLDPLKKFACSALHMLSSGDASDASSYVTHDETALDVEALLGSSGTDDPFPSLTPYELASAISDLPAVSFFRIPTPKTFSEEESIEFLSTIRQFVTDHRDFLPSEKKDFFSPDEVARNPQLLKVFSDMLYAQMNIVLFGSKLLFPEGATFEEKSFIACTWINPPKTMSPEEKEKFYHKYSTDKPENCESLECIGKKLPFIPDQIVLLRGLKTLNLSGNALTHLPKFLRQLPLEDLYLSENNFTVFPDEVFSLFSLASLDMSKNKLTNIPTAISLLRKLRELDIRENQISSLPDALTTRKRLTSLKMTGNLFTKLPDDFGELSALEFLDSRDGSLTTIPKSFSNLTKLRWCDFSGNRIESFPSVSNLTELQVLDLASNKLTEAPAGAETLPLLRGFSMANNPLSGSLPSLLQQKQEAYIQAMQVH
jgi:Leucine-rich repeat (LRR) protein